MYIKPARFVSKCQIIISTLKSRKNIDTLWYRVHCLPTTIVLYSILVKYFLIDIVSNKLPN